MLYRFLIRRLAGGLLSLWIVITGTFYIIHMLPGEPAEAALAESTVSQDVLERRREALGLDQPISEQYVRYVFGLAQGNAGISWATGQPVAKMIWDQLPATGQLALAGMSAAVALGLVLGYLAGTSRSLLIVQFSRALAGLSLSVPVMLSGTLLIWLFAITLDWLPATGQSSLATLVMPAAAVGLSVAGPIARTVDAGLRSVLHQPYLLVAQAKGLTYRQAAWRHAARVGLLPSLDVIAIQFGYLLGGAVITENLFARQGVGRLLLSAVINQDLPVVQATVILTAFIYMSLNLLADVLHSALDPRIPFQS